MELFAPKVEDANRFVKRRGYDRGIWKFTSPLALNWAAKSAISKVIGIKAVKSEVLKEALYLHRALHVARLIEARKDLGGGFLPS